jgi:two-component sensor histidine kinase
MFVTVNRISGGDLQQRANIVSNDEVGYLADSFNQMLDKIEESNIEMEMINGELEQRVKDRTVELEDALESLERALTSLREENEARKKTEQEISKSLKEKEIMLKEIHHRVKNNLQVVSSLLFFQSKKISDPKTLEIFKDGENRVKSMALIHEKLYQADDLANIDFKEYVKNLTNFLFQSYGIDRTKFKLINNVQDIKLGIDTAVPCGLILNELVTNSVKHGFKGKDNGEVKIDMYQQKEDKLLLEVSDNGNGMPNELNIQQSDSLGLRLVSNLTIQLNGKVEFFNENGVTVKVLFKKAS